MDRANSHSAGLPYLGSKISLISNAEIRYEGILYSINTHESTVALQNVRTFGTEGRRTPEVPPNNKTYQFIIFKGKDIKDLTVCEAAATVPEDPAIVTVNVPPANHSMGQAPPFHNRQVHGGDNMGNRNYGMGPGNRNMRPQQGGYVSRGNGAMRGGYGHPRDPSYPHHDNHDVDYSGRGGRHHQRGRGGHRGGARPGPRRIVGELPPQLNHAVVKEVQKAFDFEGSNAKFDKADLANQTVAATNPEPTEGGEKENSVPVTVPTPSRGYDKTSSFFDSISCETLDRKDGKDARVDRDKQRKLDCDTFGMTAADVSRGLRPRRGYRRGGPGRRGGFSYNNNAAVRAHA